MKHAIDKNMQEKYERVKSIAHISNTKKEKAKPKFRYGALIDHIKRGYYHNGVWRPNV